MNDARILTAPNAQTEEQIMIVEQVWTGNSYRNFNYLIACPETGDALAIDPLDYKKCLKVANDRGWKITQILNTHEHGDHTGGNKGMVNATGAKIIAHANAKNRIPDIDRGVGAGDIIKVGHTRINRLCSAETRCSMPVPATVTMAATRARCTKPLQTSWKSSARIR
jgi:glyoxylase-like metal-dependent hydrolase (beta-lactamase superfamily II)